MVAWTNKSSNLIMPSGYLEKKAIQASTVSAPAAMITQQEPFYEYYPVPDVAFTYTTFKAIYLNVGQTMTFQTVNSTVDPVMYVFNQGSSQSVSFVNDDGGGGWESLISFTVTLKGWYAVVLRSYYSGQMGTCTIKKNGINWVTNAAICGTMVPISYQPETGPLNYFTAKPGFDLDTKLFTMPGWMSPVNGFDDQYYGQGGDFNWGGLARIKQNYQQDVLYCLVAHSTAAPYSYLCDLYAKCGNSDIMPYFPNLKADDAIKSSGETILYNCYAWSGGITSESIKPHTDPRWNTGGGPLSKFDNYYNNYPVMRYANAISYPYRVAPSTGGVEIDLWATGSYPDYGYTHGSVMKPGNYEMHGYAWESKPGSLARTFHPRNALNGSLYGAVVYSYKRASGASAMQASGVNLAETAIDFASTPKSRAMGITRPLSLDSSILLGLTVMRNVLFSDVEKNKNSALIDKISSALKNNFNSKYEAWQKTWKDPKIAMFSDPCEYAKSAEYDSLKYFCIKQEKTIWPLLFEKAQEDPWFIQILMEEAMRITALPETPAVEAEYAGNQFTSDGAFIYTSNKDRRIAVCKKLLKKF
jgi:hypothetical protein